MGSSRRQVVLGLVFSMVLVSGCRIEGGSLEGADTAPPTSTGSPAIDVNPGPVITLDDPGAEPRQTLLLRISPGSITTVAIENRSGLQMALDGEQVTSGVVPATRMVIENRVDRVDPDGTAYFTLTVKDTSVIETPGVDPGVAAEVDAALQQLEGLRGTGTVDSHNGGQTMSFDTMAIADDTLRSTIDSLSSQVGSLSAPFPAAPIGAGARWTVRATANINGLAMNTTTRYSLRSRSGDGYQIDLTQQASAPPGAASFPNLPAGAGASIESLVMESSGEMAGDLTRQLPTTSRVSGAGGGTLIITAGTERSTLVESLTVDYRLSPA